MATILVDTTTDERDGSITDGDVSLRDALALASDGDTITFAGGPGEVFENGGTIRLEQALGELVLDRDLTIDGDLDDDGAPDITITGDTAGNDALLTGPFGKLITRLYGDYLDDLGDNTAVIRIVSGESTLEGLVITGGVSHGSYDTGYSFGGGVFISEDARADIVASSISGNESDFGGGLFNRGDATLTGSFVSENRGEGFAFNTVERFGGGIGNVGSLTLDNTVVQGNVGSPSLGGGIANSGTLTLVDSSVLDTLNRSRYSGGEGIFNSGIATLLRTTIARNGSGGRYGNGGIDNHGTLFVIDSTITENSTAIYGNGGGLSNFGDATLVNTTISDSSGGLYAGGIANYGTLKVINVTIADNSSAYTGGGGIRNSGTLSASHTTLSGNSIYSDGYGSGGLYNTGTTRFTNSVVLGNRGGADNDIQGDVTLQGSNIIGDQRFDGETVIRTGITAADVFASIVDNNGVDAGALADNGGLVETIALKNDPANPAIDAGTGALPADDFDLDGDGNTEEPLPVDARGPGFLRIVNDSVDIGAFEAQAADGNGTTIEIEARGTPAAGLFPRMKVLVDNTLLDGVTVGATEQTYTFDFPDLDIEDAAKLEIRFANDFVVNDPETGAKLEDRNLFVTRLTINGEEVPIKGNGAVVYERFSPTLDDIPGQTMLFWNGDLAVDLDAVFS